MITKKEVNEVGFKDVVFQGQQISGKVTITNGALIWQFANEKMANQIFTYEKTKQTKVARIPRKPAFIEACGTKTKEELTQEILKKFKGAKIHETKA